MMTIVIRDLEITYIHVLSFWVNIILSTPDFSCFASKTIRAIWPWNHDQRPENMYTCWELLSEMYFQPQIFYILPLKPPLCTTHTGWSQNCDQWPNKTTNTHVEGFKWCHKEFYNFYHLGSFFNTLWVRAVKLFINFAVWASRKAVKNIMKTNGEFLPSFSIFYTSLNRLIGRYVIYHYLIWNKLFCFILCILKSCLCQLMNGTKNINLT